VIVLITYTENMIIRAGYVL